MNKLIYLKKENIKPLLEKLSLDFDVHIPVQDNRTSVIEFAHLDSLNENNEINLKEKTRKSPKSLFFAATENLFEFEYIKDTQKPDVNLIKLDEEKNGQNINKKKKLVFGLKPCDAKGIKNLDLVFNENGKNDISYSENRAGSILVSIGCNNIFNDCFCLTVNGHPFDFENADIGLMDMGDFLIVSKTGQNSQVKDLIENNREYFEEKDSDEEIKKSMDKVIAASEEKLKSYMKNADGVRAGKTMEQEFKKDTIWKKISDKCVSCGACTYVCPTCVCFNIGDEIRENKGERYRCWDFCTNYNYTLEASGHNPRSEIFNRYRNKINCKFHYFYKRNKTLYCVGCGRCVEVCPVGMDIRDIITIFSPSND
jgi:sulfhydrogenase subunit beta (sulfur reductase)